MKQQNLILSLTRIPQPFWLKAAILLTPLVASTNSAFAIFIEVTATTTYILSFFFNMVVASITGKQCKPHSVSQSVNQRVEGQGKGQSSSDFLEWHSLAEGQGQAK